MAVTEITPTSIKIDKLITHIEDGNIKIPAFQRGFVWDQQQVIALLDSIYNDYPIGSILLWNSKERLKSIRNVGGFLLPDRDPEYPINYVLDGQQRLSTIYAVFCRDKTRDPNSNWYNADVEIFDIYFDLVREIFLPKEECEAGSEAVNLSLFREDNVSNDTVHKGRTYLRLNKLFDVDGFFEEMERIDKKYRHLARNVQSKFINYEIPIITTKGRSKDEVGTIFERINNTGTRLTTLDLMIAWTWSDEFHLREQITEILGTLDEKGFNDIPEKVILQCLSGITAETTKTKDILSLKGDVVRQNIDLLKRSVEKAVDFLSTEFNVNSSELLPHTQQIVGLAYFFSKTNFPSMEQAEILQKWFWRTTFSRRYSRGTDDMMNEDIVFFKAVLHENYAGLTKYSATITKNALLKQIFSKNMPFTRAFLLLLAQCQPLNLANGSKIDIGRSLSNYNRKEYHHIFPKAFLEKLGVSSERINSLCNFCFLPASVNKNISDKSPSEYIFAESAPTLFNQEPKKRDYTKILNSNLMPLEKDIYLKNDYDSFLARRAEIILEYLTTKTGVAE